MKFKEMTEESLEDIYYCLDKNIVPFIILEEQNNAEDIDDLFIYQWDVVDYKENKIALIEFIVKRQRVVDEDLQIIFNDISPSALKGLEQIKKKSVHYRRLKEQNVAFIETFALHPDLRELGLGSEIMNEFIECLRYYEVDCVYLVSRTLEAGEQPPHLFYNKLGFKPVLSKTQAKDSCVMYKKIK